ncbi:MAG: hypothetical protein LBO08_03315 [Rickettsiales bacterium]|jgi:beta-N-acetylhexosaminidase|nr:hypothetical protein [Rickettsiales bacterium]
MKRNLITLFAIPIIAALGCGAYIFAENRHLDRMIGQMIMVGFRGDGDGDFVQDLEIIKSEIRAGTVGGVILFNYDSALARDNPGLENKYSSRNIKTTAQVKRLNAELNAAAAGRPKLFIGIDQEGGTGFIGSGKQKGVARLLKQHGFIETPTNHDLARGKSTEAVFDIAKNLGQNLRGLGFNIDFAPVVDVDVNPASPAIGFYGRSFSANPDIVADYGLAFANGLSAAGIVPVLKHFPGHGSAEQNSHDGFTDVSETWLESELIPYKRIIPATDDAMVMVAHVFNKNLDAEYPASLSVKTIGMLRDMGFDGIVISDDMGMGGITNNYGQEQALELAILAGNDILCVGNNLEYNKFAGRDTHRIIKRLVRSGKIKKSRIRQSFNKIIKYKENMK